MPAMASLGLHQAIIKNDSIREVPPIPPEKDRRPSKVSSSASHQDEPSRKLEEKPEKKSWQKFVRQYPNPLIHKRSI